CHCDNQAKRVGRRARKEVGMTVYGVLIALMLCAHGAEAQRSKETKARPVKVTLQATIHGISFDGPASHGLTTLNLSLVDGTYVTVAVGGIGPCSEASACWKNSLEVLVIAEGKLWGAAKSGRQSFFVSAERLSIKSADRGKGAAAKQQ